MAIRNIRTDGDEVLRKVSKEVPEVNDKIRQLISDMIETMHDADGVGLAAPQIGILKRIIVLDMYDDKGPFAIINPEMVYQDGEQIEEEGCLSIPGYNGMVERPMNVAVKGLNENGEEIMVEGTELLARALCHEIDHLNGVLFKDKVINE